MRSFRLVPFLGQSFVWLSAILFAIQCASSGYSQILKKQNGETPAIIPLPYVTLSGNYFARDGKSFIPVGVNWVPAKAAMQWPYRWDPGAIEADFEQMHQLGVNTVRLDLVWAWFEPRPGDYNPEAFTQFHFLLTLANRYHIYLQPCLLIGGEVGEAYWDVPYRQGRNPQADPEMLRLETDFAAEIARRFGKESAILSWDLTDEPPFWIVSHSTTDAMAINWTRLISGAIRHYDSLHPLVAGTSTEDIGHGPFRPDNLREEMDFFSVHPYSIYAQKLFPDSMLSVRGTYGGAFETALSSGAGRPVMIQELGASSAQYSPEKIALYLQAVMYSGLAAGANGFLTWCYTDTAPEQYGRVPYLRSPHETQFGLVTWDHKQRPAAKMFSQFARTLGALDLTGIEPAPAEAAILVPNEWAKPLGDQSHFGLIGPEIVPYTSLDDTEAADGQSASERSEGNARITGAWLSTYILAHQAGMKSDLPREYGAWQKHPMVLLPSPLTSTDNVLVHLHSDFWASARKYVENGGALYASVSSDAAIPEMQEIFGARLSDHVAVRNVTLTMVSPFGDLKPGDSFHYEADPGSPSQWAATLEVGDGKVLAVDQDGKPALVLHQLGRGSTLLCAYPIESYLANTPSAFDKNEDTYRIYTAFRDAVHLQPLIHTDDPSVEASALDGKNHGYIVIVNHAASIKHVSLSGSLPIHSLTRLPGGEGRQVAGGGTRWTLDLKPYEGTVLEWR